MQGKRTLVFTFSSMARSAKTSSSAAATASASAMVTLHAMPAAVVAEEALSWRSQPLAYAFFRWLCSPLAIRQDGREYEH